MSLAAAQHLIRWVDRRASSRDVLDFRWREDAGDLDRWVWELDRTYLEAFLRMVANTPEVVLNTHIHISHDNGEQVLIDAAGALVPLGWRYQYVYAQLMPEPDMTEARWETPWTYDTAERVREETNQTFNSFREILRGNAVSIWTDTAHPRVSPGGFARTRYTGNFEEFGSIELFAPVLLFPGAGRQRTIMIIDVVINPPPPGTAVASTVTGADTPLTPLAKRAPRSHQRAQAAPNWAIASALAAAFAGAGLGFVTVFGALLAISSRGRR